jgi:hypothetical protein
MDFGGKLNFPNIYFRPTGIPGWKRLVKNNKVKCKKPGETTIDPLFFFVGIPTKSQSSPNTY